MITRLLIACVLSVGMLISSGLSVLAADFTVAPLAYNYDLERRDIVNGLITVTNPTDRKLRLYASVNEVATDGDGIIQSFTPPSMTDRTSDPTSWIQITRARLEVPAGEQLEVPYTVKLHPQTDPGQYSVFIGFAAASNQPQAKQLIRAGRGIGTLLNIDVAQENNQFLRLERFSVDRFVNGEGGSLTFTVHNPGQAPVTPSGDVTFFNTRGEEIVAVPINDAAVLVEEKQNHTFELALPADLALGKYKAFLSLEYGTKQRAAVTDSEFFYVAPLTQLILLFLGLMVIVVVITLLVYRRYDDGPFDGTEAVAMYISSSPSPAADHDIDLKQPRHDQSS